MALLSRSTLRDRLHYLIAFLCTVISGVAGMLAMHQMRMLVLTWVAYAGYHSSGRRLANIAAWVVLGVAWAVYAMLIEHYYRDGVTEARQEKAYTTPNKLAPPTHPVMRYLWRHDLHITFTRFVKTLPIPIVIFIVAYVTMRFLLGALISS